MPDKRINSITASNYSITTELKVISATNKFFAIKQPLMHNEWSFLLEKKKVFFSRYLDFCVFVKSTNVKICDIIIGIANKFFAIKQPLMHNEWSFLLEKKKVFFSRYLDFCVFVKSTNVKICDIIIGIATEW